MFDRQKSYLNRLIDRCKRSRKIKNECRQEGTSIFPPVRAAFDVKGRAYFDRKRQH